jgi:hypothetical protein
MSHWSSGLPVCFPSQGTRFKSPGGYLCETRILLLVMSRYIGDPDVIDHFCGLVWGGLRPEPSLGPHADNVIIPLDLTQLFCPGFTLTAGAPSSFTTDGVSCWGGSPVESLQSHFILTISHRSSGLPVCFLSQGTQFQIPRGVLIWNQDSPVSDVSLHNYKSAASRDCLTYRGHTRQDVKGTILKLVNFWTAFEFIKPKFECIQILFFFGCDD